MIHTIEPKPIIRWAGSKKKLISRMMEYVPKSCTSYIEPFVGSGQLLLKFKDYSCTIGDVNFDLINFYICLKTDFNQVFSIYQSFIRNKEEYYRLRAIDIPTGDLFFDAARFLFLNENCFNGLYRVNLKGKFNVPYSPIAYSSGKSFSNFELWATLLKNCDIINKDFEEVVSSSLKKDSFVYLDPPYAQSNKRIFTQYDAKTFGLQDMKRLDYLLDYINKKGAKFMLSYAKSEEIEFISDKWKVTELTTYRSMAGFNKARNYQSEFLITNYV